MIRLPWAVLLAAGASQRFGRPKLLARYRGQTLLLRAARTALAVCPGRTIVVLGATRGRLAAELRGLPLQVVVNRGWREGQATSLRCGLDALPPSASAALLLLADQPAVTPAGLRRLLAAWRRSPHSVVAAVAEGLPQAPAVLPRRTFARLRRLTGDEGARSLLRDPAEKVIGVRLPGAARDVDRPADLGRARR